MSNIQSVILPTGRLPADRRAEPRLEIKMPIQYRIDFSESYSKGILINLSQSGALIAVPDKLEINTPIDLLIPSDESSQDDPIQVQAVVVRQAATDLDGMYAYGCCLANITDPN